MAKKLKELEVGTKVYSELHKKNGVIQSIETASDGSDNLIYVVRLSNGDVRQYLAEQLGAPQQEKEEGEEEEEGLPD